MLPNKRRSAYSVYLESASRGGENDENVESNGRREAHTQAVRSSKSNMTPKNKAAKRDKNAGNTTADDAGSKSRKSIISKANKLRRSLQLSGKKKKRGRSMAGANEMEKAEKVAVLDKDESGSDTVTQEPVQKKPRSARSTASLACNQHTRSTASISSSASGKHPVSTYSMGSTNSLADTSNIQNESEAETLIKWLLSPVKPKKFFSDLWGRKPLLIKRHQPSYNQGWFSTEDLDEIMRKHFVRFSVNLDVTSYTDGKRETHNPDGRAHAPVVWDFYQNGCSVRMLNPQTFSQTVWKLTSCLQEYFGCFVGANVYLTPPGTQGFAPHYDDIEAFIIQLEGKKHWRLYNPRCEEEALPRFSSGNFSQEEIGEPILDTVLEAGDMLYFPRGTIHQGDTPDDSHSLHITVSTYQRNTWGDFLEKLVPRALQIACQEDPEFRQGLPINYLNYTGVANSDSISKERSEFLRKTEKLMSKLISHAPVDEAADQMGVSVIKDCLPPVLTKDETTHSIYGTGASWDGRGVTPSDVITGETAVKLIRKGIARILNEEDGVSVYHTMENSRIYHESEPQKLDFNSEAGPVIECIFNSHPDYVRVGDLPHENIDFKVDVVTMLYERGLLITSEPLTTK